MIVRSQRRPDDSWLFTVCYTARFTPAEVGKRFHDAVLVGPVSDGSNGSAVCEMPVSFTATGEWVYRKKRIVVRGGSCASTAPVCAWIRLHGLEGADPVDEQCTPPVFTAGTPQPSAA
jgi:hypothetical protein